MMKYSFSQCYRHNSLRKGIRALLLVGVGTFFLAIIVGLASVLLLRAISSMMLAFLLLFIIVLVGIIFDIIGTASTVAKEPPFHAKAALRIAGAEEAVFLVRNAEKVANFCNDVVGDICGTISGAIGALVAFRILHMQPSWNEMGISVLLSALVAALTVGGKAWGKIIAVKDAHDIMFAVGRIIARVNTVAGLPLSATGNTSRKRS